MLCSKGSTPSTIGHAPKYSKYVLYLFRLPFSHLSSGRFILLELPFYYVPLFVCMNPSFSLILTLLQRHSIPLSPDFSISSISDVACLPSPSLYEIRALFHTACFPLPFFPSAPLLPLCLGLLLHLCFLSPAPSYPGLGLLPS